MNKLSEEQIFSQEMEFPFYFANLTGDMRLSSLVDAMLLTSEKQLHQSDSDSSEMVKRGLGWVVVQYHMDVTSMPQLGQKLNVRTRATSYNKYFFYRDFWIDDLDGNNMVKLESAFVIIDVNERKMVSAADKLDYMFGAEEITKIKRFPRVKTPKEYDIKRDQQIGYYNIDVNRHVNNSYYFDWMVDSLGIEFVEKHRVKTMDIKYEKELDINSHPEVFAKISDDGLETTHWIQNGNDLNVVAKMTWEDK
ncbi:acyl-[acyl-carrier-protein] thioesterase [Companilactobacillus kedongensis]|uniref:acyl-[acyl-carrier-protein] thioesterase n=1 Tax=Companilactobacillus kedongensis TaxID=2486004 RepID=UPI000F7AE338|nr:acyl-ACP thioesterase domain-containing protein [Companilactobacillus kedongensis]